MDMSLSKLWETVKDRVCCSPWGLGESDMSKQLNNNITHLYVPGIGTWTSSGGDHWPAYHISGGFVIHCYDHTLNIQNEEVEYFLESQVIEGR